MASLIDPPNFSTDIYALMGFTLTYLQSVERILRFVTTFVLQDGENLSIEKLQSLETKESKKTLGYFMFKIRDRAQLFPKLDQLLETYLKNRNDFIHSHSAIPGWDLSSKEGVAVAREFTSKLLRQGHEINKVFIALIMRWQDQAGMQPPDVQHSSEFFQDVERTYGHWIDEFFTSKEP